MNLGCPPLKRTALLVLARSALFGMGPYAPGASPTNAAAIGLSIALATAGVLVAGLAIRRVGRAARRKA